MKIRQSILLVGISLISFSYAAPEKTDSPGENVDRVLSPFRFEASSVLEETMNYDYRPTNASDNQAVTAWAEGVPGDGLGEFIKFEFFASVRLSKIEIINGFAEMHKTLGDLYYLNNRVKKIRLEFEDGAEEFSLADRKKSYQTLVFAKVHKSLTMKLIILEVYAGKKWKDTCISEVKFYGSPAAPGR